MTITPERIAEIEAALSRILPIATTETPDYAELSFGECRTQAMTVEPDTWLALNGLPDLLSAYKKAMEALEAIAGYSGLPSRDWNERFPKLADAVARTRGMPTVALCDYARAALNPEPESE